MEEKKKLTEEMVTPVAATAPEVGIDTTKSIISDMINSVQLGTLDVSSIDALSASAQTREQTYELLDAMASDEAISAVLKIYTSETIQTNDKGEKIWVESSDPHILEYTSWLMDSLNIDKKLNSWVYCLVTYGDVYVRLYRKSDYTNDLLFQNNKRNRRLNEAINPQEPLTEDVMLRVYKNDDPYVPYVEMVPNPGEMFDLQKFGKTFGYIKTPVRMIQQTTDQLYNYLTRYKMRQNDIEIYDATSFVHACIESTSQRQPETVDIYLDSVDNSANTDSNTNDGEYQTDSNAVTSYSVKRGQSILYNVFRIWRELNLLEMSALLNRITQSSVVRIITVDTADMPKEQVQVYLQRLKEKIEQKSALNTDTSLGEYNNPGPIINTIYVPTTNGHGSINVTNLGGDFDPKSLTDIEYFRDQLYGALLIPKQYVGITDDNTGFNGGSALTIISAQFGKTIKEIQALMCQLVTDIINLFLIDRGLNNWVNKFSVRMQTPVTQEEIDKRANMDNRIRYVSDVMQQMSDIEDKVTRLKIQKALLTDVVNDPEVMKYFQEYIDSLEAEQNPSDEGNTEEASFGESEPLPEMPNEEPEEPVEEDINEEEKEVLVEDSTDDDFLPTPEDLNYDALNNKVIK